MILKDKKIGVISLGCDKNRVDSEKMLSLISDFGSLTNDITQANIIIINTCAFLQSSRKEAIDTIFECNAYRQTGKLEKLVVTGCLPQKFIGEIFDDLPEVDVFLGFKDYDYLKQALEKAYDGERVNFVGVEKEFKKIERVVTTPLNYAYLKIADGCNNHCTYCLIPYIRGKYVSETMESLVEEAAKLGNLSELILVAQDVTKYGEDLYGEVKLVELIKRLSSLENVRSIRLLYCYPENIDDKLIEEIATNDKVLKYIDIPLQHASDSVLKRMNRKGSGQFYSSLFKKLREKIKGIAIRSTFITGFPGETEEDFEILCDFVRKEKMFNVGFFAYSREEGTPAYKLPDQIDEKTKRHRVKQLYKIQKEVAKEIMKSFVGKTLEVVCDGIDYDNQLFIGRAYYSAPEIDGCVYFTSDSVVEQGEKYLVKINKAKDYDLYGGTVENE